MDPLVCDPTVLDIANALAWFLFAYVVGGIIAFRMVTTYRIMPAKTRSFARSIGFIIGIAFICGVLVSQVHIIG